MNTKLLACIAMGVFVAHMAVFMIIGRVREWNRPAPPPPPEPNFKFAERVISRGTDGSKVIKREISVSTELKPELYQGRPERPVGE